MVPVLEVWYWRQPGGPAISFKPQSYWVTLILQLLFRVEPKPTWKLALWHDWLASTHTKKKDIELSTKKMVIDLLLCCPAFAPHMTGVPIPPVIEKRSVIQSPIASPLDDAGALSDVVPVWGPARVKSSKSNLLVKVCLRKYYLGIIFLLLINNHGM